MKIAIVAVRLSGEGAWAGSGSSNVEPVTASWYHSNTLQSTKISCDNTSQSTKPLKFLDRKNFTLHLKTGGDKKWEGWCLQFTHCYRPACRSISSVAACAFDEAMKTIFDGGRLCGILLPPQPDCAVLIVETARYES
jgi:hypothetical protein